LQVNHAFTETLCAKRPAVWLSQPDVHNQGPACQFAGRMIECEAMDKPGSPGFFFRRGAENALCFRLKNDHAE
jgi:hypothetical protein